jgi:predicted nucleotidyltransferase
MVALRSADDPFLPKARDQLLAEAHNQPHPLIFMTVSGAHLYGFPSADSDYDLRGSHVTPLRNLVGLENVRETIEDKSLRDGLEIETVTHDVRKYIRLLLKHNGYVLEQLYSPLVVQTTPGHEELKGLGRGCITRKHALHYRGFAHNEWALLQKKPSLKRLLYIYRVLLTGIHLMRTGEVEANLVRLNSEYPQPQIPDLIQQKIGGTEWGEIEGDLGFHFAEYQRLLAELESAAESSSLPESESTREALNDFLIRTRLGSFGGN